MNEGVFTFEKAMYYIDDISHFGSVLGLENIKELMKRLGNPQDCLHFVHVAGTNGKGSVCTYIASILMEAGYRVGRYISPTIFGYLERIQVSQKWMSEDDFANKAAKVKKAADAMVSEGHVHPTVFEIETAVAFLEFADKKCDIVVLEVGLGGALDSTNVIKTADCAVLTSVSMDHMAILGDTIQKIAGQKAGIIKNNMNVISYPQEKEAAEVFVTVCKKREASLKFANLNSIEVMEYSLEGTSFLYKGNAFSKSMQLFTQMLTKNQVANALLSIETAGLLNKNGYTIQEEHVIKGIKEAKWEGRFSIVHTKPYVIVDGAHNADAANSLKESVSLYFQDKKIIRILGVFKDKEYEKIIKNSVDKLDTVITIRPNHERGLDSSKLFQCAQKYCKNVRNEKTIEKALDRAMQEADEDSVILAYGSLSFLSEIYKYFSLIF